MRIACASCNAAYDVPSERVPPGKGVKCARCGTIWVPVEREESASREDSASLVPIAEAHEATPQPSSPNAPVPGLAGPELLLPVLPLSAPEALRTELRANSPAPERVLSEPLLSEHKERPARAALLAWAASVLVLLALCWAALHYRGAIVGAWPNAARAYTLIGL
jgi:predicted Zn finger-like uncharacterized protein